MRVAFDIGNVLVGVDRSEFFKEFRKVVQFVDPAVFTNDIQSLHDIGVETLSISLRYKLGLSDSSIDTLVGAWNKSIRPNEEMLDFVEGLKRDGIEVALLSNVGLDHAVQLRERYHIFDGCILHLSCEVGARKPTKLYYQSFLAQYPRFIGAIFLDDRIENLEAAQEFGLRGYHFELDKFMQKTEEYRASLLRSLRSMIDMRGKADTEHIEVSTDGITVWVNKCGECIGRFCELSGEIMLPDRRIEGTNPDWKEWVTLLFIRRDFLVNDKYQPEWSKSNV